MLLVRAEEGIAFRRADAEGQAREILALVLAGATSDARPSIPEVAAQPYSVVGLAPGGARERGSAA